MSSRQPYVLRIDIPLRSTSLYLYVEELHRRWSPWWDELYRYLLALAPTEIEWRHEPVQDVYIARPVLTDEQRRALADRLRAAPAHEAARHRTLQRATRLTADQDQRLAVVYFSHPRHERNAMHRDYPDLVQFFAGYFHEDWPEEAATPDAVLDSFIRARARDELVQLADRIDAFTELRDDRSLEDALFNGLGCYYVPAADGMSARSWLQHVSDRLRTGA